MSGSTLTRPQKGMQLAMRTHKTWTASVVGLRIPSQSQAGVYYTVTPTGCDCGDSRYRVGTPNGPSACKHSLAMRLMLSRRNAA